jgi:hypothetical protein
VPRRLLLPFNLPFLVVDVLAQPDEVPVTLDARTTRFMRLTPEFVAAQVGPPAKVAYSTIICPFMTIQWPGEVQRYG